MLRNIGWNWGGMLVDVCAGFVVAPFLVRRLGVDGYGLWIIIGSLSGYFSLVDLGLRGSVARQLSLHRAREEWDLVNQTFNSGLLILCSLGVVTLLAMGIGALAFEQLFEVPPEQLENARLSLMLVGLSLALSFPLQVFDGYLWAAQRFDLLNAVDIPITLMRVALTFIFVRGPEDIVALGVVTLGTTACAGFVKAVLSFKRDSFLRIRFTDATYQSGRTLFGYGQWSFILNVARLTKTQLSPVMIGSLLGVAMVTPYSIARRLQDSAHRVIWTATGVLVPVATTFHARTQATQQQRLFIEGGKYSTLLAVYFVGYFLCLGEPLIELWIGPDFGHAALLLAILALGEFGQMTQSVAGSIILATARHRNLAGLAVAEMIISIVLVIPMSKAFGLIGACLAFALPQALLSGIGTMIIGCRITGVGIMQYARHALIPAVLIGTLPIGGLALLRAWQTPHDWITLILYSLGYTSAYGIACWFRLKPDSGVQVFDSLKSAFFRA